MRVFVGYGYHDRDRWVEEYVFPLVEAFGCEVVHGKAVFGGTLADEVIRAIRTADAMIGFTTRRDPAGPDQFYTHPWVVQELVTAYGQTPPIPFVEVREQGVPSPGGMLDAANAQRIDYREQDRAACLVQIAQALRRFREATSVTMMRLVPSEVADQIGPLLDDPAFICQSRTLRAGAESDWRNVPILPIKGGVFVQLRSVAEGDLVRVRISAGGRTWVSSYESLDAYTVDMQLKGQE